MAPSKRKARDEDFYYTISDDEGPVRLEEELVDQPPQAKKSKTKADDIEDVWGENEEDDGDLDPNFEFIDGYDDLGGEDITGHGLEWRRSDLQRVNLDDIIQRKREKKEKSQATSAQDENGHDDQSDVDLDMDDDADGVLAADGFGMGADSDAEESTDGRALEEERDEGDDDDEPASDDDSVATPIAHPDDEDIGSSNEDEVDEEELEKQKAFFAPEAKQKPGKPGLSSFEGMGLSRPVLSGVAAAGFKKPTQIQAKTIPFALEGKDVVGQAVTGSGKTAAFLLPILERLFYGRTKVSVTRVVVLTPTRELAIQCHKVAQTLARATGITMALTVGGTSFKASEKDLRSRPDVVIATPGRFIDHMRNSLFPVDRVEILVLDEADRMLQDGFAEELNEIVTTLPKRRQTMLFSATMNSSVDQLIRVGLNKPVRILADPQKKSVGTLVQEFVRLRPGREDKRMGYLVHLCKTIYTERVILFFREKKDIHRTRVIFGLLGLACVELHGDIPQSQRVDALESFRRGSVPFLLASDLASRGLDIKGVETVINYETPKNQDDYIHRIGRTARAGRRGVAVTIVTDKDRKFVKTTAKSMETTTKLKSRSIEPSLADAWQDKVDELEDDVEEILQEEKEAKDLAQMEMEVTKGENLIKHHDEIMSRPRRTWFEKTEETGKAKKPDSVQRLREKLKRKNTNGNLSNKDKKKLDSHSDRLSNKEGKKLKQDKKEQQRPRGQKGGKPGGRKGDKKFKSKR